MTFSRIIEKSFGYLKSRHRVSNLSTFFTVQIKKLKKIPFLALNSFLLFCTNYFSTFCRYSFSYEKYFSVLSTPNSSKRNVQFSRQSLSRYFHASPRFPSIRYIGKFDTSTPLRPRYDAKNNLNTSRHISKAEFFNRYLARVTEYLRNFREISPIRRGLSEPFSWLFPRSRYTVNKVPGAY